MTDRTTVLVGYDGTPEADQALRWAIDTAAREGRPLRIATVEEVNGDPELELAEWAAIEAEAKKLVTVAGMDAELAKVDAPQATVGLLDLAAEAAMVVVGSRGHGVMGELVMGSVSQHLARHAPCTVVVAREPRTIQHRVVVGVDGSELSLEALRFGCRHALATGAVVIAIHAKRPRRGSSQVGRDGNVPPVRREDYDDDLAALTADVEAVATEFPGLRVETEVVLSRATDALVGASQAADLVVVGSRGHGGFAGLLLGSVSDDVLRRAACTVAVVR